MTLARQIHHIYTTTINMTAAAAPKVKKAAAKPVVAKKSKPTKAKVNKSRKGASRGKK